MLQRDRISTFDDFLNNNRNCPEEWFLDDECLCPRCDARVYARFYYDCIDRDYQGVETECRECGWWEIME